MEGLNQPFLSENEIQATLAPPLSPFLLRKLYLGHFLSRWGARMWEFSVGLYMINIWPDSLLFTALYGVVESCSIALFGPIIGNWVDKVSYIEVLRIWLLTQNLSFMLAGGAVFILLTDSSLKSAQFSIFIGLIILVNVSGAVGVLSSLSGTILVEREWIVEMSKNQPSDVLVELNSVIRRIDLSCKLLAPVFTGLLISFVSLGASSLALLFWNVLSVFVEYWLLRSVYQGIPALNERRKTRTQTSCSENLLVSSYSAEETGGLPSQMETSLTVAKCWHEKLFKRILKAPAIDAWVVYVKQTTVLPGISLSLLYFTVLSFGTLMTAALEWEGVPAFIIGLARGMSAVVGISATLVYPMVHSHLLCLRTGLWSIWSQWCFLLLCVSSIWVHNNQISAWMLMGGVAASRLGLWMFDLSVIQQMQESVPDSDRCAVGGVQNSLQSFMDLMQYVMGIIISNPQEFWKLIIISFASVTVASMLYSFHTQRISKSPLPLQ
ncbi:Solute carrier family 40 member 2 [Nymphaea thermarum]|nr:Solute carrier family 40 member 2 [Nymphaea thermarum]